MKNVLLLKLLKSVRGRWAGTLRPEVAILALATVNHRVLVSGCPHLNDTLHLGKSRYQDKFVLSRGNALQPDPTYALTAGSAEGEMRPFAGNLLTSVNFSQDLAISIACIQMCPYAHLLDRGAMGAHHRINVSQAFYGQYYVDWAVMGGSVLSAATADGIRQVTEFSSANVGRKKSTFYGFTTIKFYCKLIIADGSRILNWHLDRLCKRVCPGTGPRVAVP
ncbi:hypothetical protein E5288_WYG011354 [Bos mutus]|uniref:Uncharacterized protein n=1 Tax=Bos mutus TaxID=72004 RepID=A0A6B0R6M8_9CETA|nr:hypothetical protein [Bos mutus]